MEREEYAGARTRMLARALARGAAGILLAISLVSVAWAQTAQARGEVRRVDAVNGTITIKHDAISALGLPAMTLVYQAAPSLLGGLKPGDKIGFTAALKDNKYVVTQLSK